MSRSLKMNFKGSGRGLPLNPAWRSIRFRMSYGRENSTVSPEPLSLFFAKKELLSNGNKNNG